jgi:hypothetical protein
MKLLLDVVLTVYSAGAMASGSDLILIDEVRADQATIYIGESRYYLDKSSINVGTINSVPFYTARTVMTRPPHPDSVDQIAVICDHPSLGTAISIRKFGTANGEAVEYIFDQGPVQSLADFDLKQLGSGPATVFSKVAQAICKIEPPISAEMPSNSSFKPTPLRGAA